MDSSSVVLKLRAALAEGFVRIAGTRDPLASGDWRVKSVTFTLDAGGLKMSFSGVFS